MNRFKNQILLAAGFAVLAGVITGITAVPAIAQAIKAALVKNVDEPGRVPFQVVLNDVTPGNGGCFASTLPVPTGKRLVLQHVNADIELGGVGNKVQIFRVTVGGGLSIGNSYLHPELNDGSGGYNYYVVNSDVRMYLDAGQAAQVDGFFSTSGTPEGCRTTLTGYLVDVTI